MLLFFVAPLETKAINLGVQGAEPLCSASSFRMADFLQEDIMAKNAHLTLSERIIIESCLRDGMPFKQIAQEVGKDPSTISKEVRGHFKVIEKDTYNPCRYRR